MLRTSAPTHVANMVPEPRSGCSEKVTPKKSRMWRSVRTAWGVSGPSRSVLASCASGQGWVWGAKGVPYDV